LATAEETDSVNAADDERTVHRIEAFSDIVIGFCLAEIGVSLIVPRSAADFSAIWPSVGAFALSFLIIVVLWWHHHRIFKTYFVLNRLSMVANFAMLGSLVLMTYFLQTTVRFIDVGENPALAVRCWFFSFAAIYALLAVLLGDGLRVRWPSLDSSDRRWGLGRLLQLALIVVVIFALGFVVASVHGKQLQNAAIGMALFLLIAGRAIVPALLRRFL
jgi:uncharacterized membrane protein